MKALFRKIGSTLQRLNRDDGGAHLVEYILVIAAIGLPLLGVIIYFRQELKDWFLGLWTDVTDDPQTTDPGV